MTRKNDAARNRRAYEKLGKEANAARKRLDYERHKPERAKYNREYQRAYLERNYVVMRMYNYLMHLVYADEKLEITNAGI